MTKIYGVDAKENKIKSGKRVDIVSIKMVKEKSVIYADRILSSPDDSANLFRSFIEDSDREQMILCCLDTKNRPTLISVISIGTLNSALVHPREVFKAAILSNAASIILAHNHPSGDTTPSSEDLSLTRRIKEVGEFIGIKLLDHIIIGQGDYTSLKEEGML